MLRHKTPQHRAGSRARRHDRLSRVGSGAQPRVASGRDGLCARLGAGLGAGLLVPRASAWQQTVKSGLRRETSGVDADLERRRQNIGQFRRRRGGERPWFSGCHCGNFSTVSERSPAGFCQAQSRRPGAFDGLVQLAGLALASAAPGGRGAKLDGRLHTSLKLEARPRRCFSSQTPSRFPTQSVLTNKTLSRPTRRHAPCSLSVSLSVSLVL